MSVARFEERLDAERMQHLLSCVQAIADAEMEEEFSAISIAIGSAIIDLVMEAFHGPERVVFLSLLGQFIEEMLQDESDAAWERFAEAVVADMIGDEPCR